MLKLIELISLSIPGIDEREYNNTCDSQQFTSGKNKTIAQSKSVVSNTGKNIAE
jgi:hypothetical protein